MKKVKMLIGVCLLMIWLCGCDSEKKEDETMNKVIKKVIIGYEQDTNTQIEVSVNVKTGERIKSVITTSLEEEKSEYASVEELVAFIENRVLNAKADSNSEGNTDDQKIIWEIRIRFDGENESYSEYGFSDYPEYWEELKILMEK